MTGRRRDSRPFHLILTAVLLMSLAVFGLGACGGEMVVDQATAATMESDDFQELVSDATDGLVEHLGGDEAGFYAVILSLDQGYDVCQLLTGSLNERVDAEGRVTGSDGSLVVPARTPERIIEPASDEAEQGTRSLTSGSPLSGVRLASIAPPLLVADSVLDPHDRIAVLAQGCGLGVIHDLGREMLRERELEQQRFLAQQHQALEAQEQAFQEQLDLEDKWDFRVSRLAVNLGARGYSAKQILEAILLDNVRFDLDMEQGGSEGCWYIEHSPGVILRPVHPPANILNELTCPAADADAPTELPSEDVKEAVANASETGPSPDDAEETTTTTVAAPDPDGIANGIYVGEVNVASEVSSPVFEITQSIVELDVTDDGVQVTVEYVQRSSGRWGDADRNCIYTISMLFSGRGSITNPLSVVLKPVEQEIISLEGNICGAGEGWDESYEDTLLAFFAEERARTLSGSFTEGTFEGTLSDSPLGVRAVVGD